MGLRGGERLVPFLAHDVACGSMGFCLAWQPLLTACSIQVIHDRSKEGSRRHSGGPLSAPQLLGDVVVSVPYFQVLLSLYIQAGRWPVWRGHSFFALHKNHKGRNCNQRATCLNFHPFCFPAWLPKHLSISLHLCCFLFSPDRSAVDAITLYQAWQSSIWSCFDAKYGNQYHGTPVSDRALRLPSLHQNFFFLTFIVTGGFIESFSSFMGIDVWIVG